jgi:glyoxylase-like metal-dependent hydrolase (beta-lactamase superfamily II)
MSTNDTPVEVSKGIFKIKIPIPFNTKYVNAYLIDAGVLSLIDVGPKTSDAANALNQSLRKLGLSLKNVDRVIFTHRHVDHIGMGNTIKMITNAETYIHESEKETATNFYEEFDRFMESILNPILQAGVPIQVVNRMTKYYDLIKRVCEPVEIDKTLKDGDTLNLGRVKLRVIHCPGHSIGSICLYEKEGKLLFTGDHILKEITPNPFISVLHDKAPLKRYLDSLRKVENLDVDISLPGHGDLIYDHRSVIANLYKHHEARKRIIMKILERGPKTPYEVLREMFGNLPTSEILLGLAEAAGHLEELLSENKVESFRKGDLIYFRKTG